MFKSGFLLSTDAHLKAAMYNKTFVNVWQGNKIIEYGGVIEKITEQSVYKNGGYFLKDTCEFKIR